MQSATLRYGRLQVCATRCGRSNYIVQISTNIANSNGWLSLYTNIVPGSGVINYTDTNAPTNAQRYYRLQFP
jgi:hypothetical protein